MLNEKIEHYKETGKMLKNTHAQYKENYPFLKDMDSLAPRQCPVEFRESLQKFLLGQVHLYSEIQILHYFYEQVRMESPNAHQIPKYVPFADIRTAKKPCKSANGPIRSVTQPTIRTSLPARTSWLWPSKRKYMR